MLLVTHYIIIIERLEIILNKYVGNKYIKYDNLTGNEIVVIIILFMFQ